MQPYAMPRTRRRLSARRRMPGAFARHLQGEPVLDRIHVQLQPAGDAELVVHRGQVVAQGVLGNEQAAAPPPCWRCRCVRRWRRRWRVRAPVSVACLSSSMSRLRAGRGSSSSPNTRPIDSRSSQSSPPMDFFDRFQHLLGRRFLVQDAARTAPHRQVEDARCGVRRSAPARATRHWPAIRADNLDHADASQVKVEQDHVRRQLRGAGHRIGAVARACPLLAMRGRSPSISFCSPHSMVWWSSTSITLMVAPDAFGAALFIPGSPRKRRCGRPHPGARKAAPPSAAARSLIERGMKAAAACRRCRC